MKSRIAAAIVFASVLSCHDGHREPPPRYPASELQIVVDCDDGIKNACWYFQTNFEVAAQVVRDQAVKNLGATLPYKFIRVRVEDEWPDRYYSSRTHGQITMRPCRGDGNAMIRKGWLCGAAFELTMMMVECPGYCGKEHANDWKGYENPASVEMDKALRELEWNGPDVTLPGH